MEDDLPMCVNLFLIFKSFNTKFFNGRWPQTFQFVRQVSMLGKVNWVARLDLPELGTDQPQLVFIFMGVSSSGNYFGWSAAKMVDTYNSKHSGENA